MPWLLQLGSFWTFSCRLNYNTRRLDVLSSARLSFIQRVWVQTLWQNASILLKCPWANVWISNNACPAVLLLTLYLDHSAGGWQANRWTSRTTRQYGLIFLNRCENRKERKKKTRCYFICSLQRTLTRNCALCSSGDAWGVCSIYHLSFSKAVDSLSSNLGC